MPLNGNAREAGPARRLDAALQLAGVALIALYLIAFVARNVPLQWDLKL
jgi:hypothetical protein